MEISVNKIKFSKKTGVLVPLLLFILSFLVVNYLETDQRILGTTDVGETHKVHKVVDGDTIVIDLNGDKTTIRLIGINTPETVDPRKTVECFGFEASQKLKSLLEGQMVQIETDPEINDKDKYGRLLRYVYLANGIDVNKVMLLEGFAYENDYGTPYSHQSDYKSAQYHAIQNNLGLWSDNTCGGQP